MGLINKLFSKIERKLSVNWFNPIATMYFNLRCLPFKEAIKFPIAIYGRPKFLELSGRVRFLCPIKLGLIKVNCYHSDAPSYQGNQTEILLRGTIIFKGIGQIDTGTKIYVGQNAILELGNKFKITDCCNVGCSKYIKLDDYCRVAHRCQILDSNYHFLANLNKDTIPPIIKPIVIGKHVWIGNSTTITCGAKIPDGTVVASNSMVNKDMTDIPEYSMIGGIPAKLIGSGFRRVEDVKLNKELYHYYSTEPEELYRLGKNQNQDIFEHE